MESGEILDESIRASDWETDYPPSKARINLLDVDSKWSANGNVTIPWIQADIQYQTYVSGVLTQGGEEGWITLYSVSTFLENSETFVKNELGGKVSFDFIDTSGIGCLSPYFKGEKNLPVYRKG